MTDTYNPTGKTITQILETQQGTAWLSSVMQSNPVKMVNGDYWQMDENCVGFKCPNHLVVDLGSRGR